MPNSKLLAQLSAPQLEDSGYLAVKIDGGQSSIFAGIGIAPQAGIRSIWFSAGSEVEARLFCEQHNFAFVGPAAMPALAVGEPDAYDVEDAMRRLNLSRSTVYRLLRRGELKRLRGVGAVRITRRSLDAYVSSAQ